MEGDIIPPERVNKIRDEDGRTLLAWSRRLYMPVPYDTITDECIAR